MATFRYDTKKRLVDILSEVQEIVKNTIAPSVPNARQYYEGWVFYVRPVRNAQTLLSSDVSENTTNWLIEILSPDVGLNLKNTLEDNMLKYADALQTTLNSKPRLENVTRQPLDGCERAVIIDDSGLIAPSGYPAGQSANEYYVYRFTLQVKTIGSAC